MQIELIGCTSAGKSTLARSMLRVFNERSINAVMSDDFVLNQARLNWVRGRLARTLLVDLLTLSTCLATWRNNLDFYKFTVQIVRQLPTTIGWFERLNIARNVFKNVGKHEIIRHRGSKQQIVLMDEGTLHTAHYLFVHTTVRPSSDQLSSFVRFVPLPDGAIYVHQDTAVLVERTLARGHKRIPDGSLAHVELFIDNAVQAFDELVQHAELREGLLLMEIEQGTIITQECQGQSLPTEIADIVKTAVNAVEQILAANPSLLV